LETESAKLISRIAEYLRTNQAVTPPSWAPYVKTGVNKKRPPDDPNWWYVRCASLLRKLYVKAPIGVARMRKQYGGRHRAKLHPAHFAPGSGAIIRKAFQQLEKANLVTTWEKKGRVLTPAGRQLLEQAAKTIAARK